MITYIKLHKLSWLRNYQNPQKFNEETYLTVQIVTDNTIKHRHTLYRITGKFGGGGVWRIWRIVYDLPN